VDWITFVFTQPVIWHRLRALHTSNTRSAPNGQSRQLSGTRPCAVLIVKYQLPWNLHLQRYYTDGTLVLRNNKEVFIFNECVLFLSGFDQFYYMFNRNHSWNLFQTFAVFWMLYAFFWVIPRRLNFICRRFETFCSIFIGR